MRLFQEHGFEQVSVGQIAAGAGVSVPTFYAHFPSKEHLVMQLPTARRAATALLAGQPAGPAGGRRGSGGRHPVWIGQWTRGVPRGRARRGGGSSRRRRPSGPGPAEFERATAGMVADALPPTPPGSCARPTQIVVNAYLSAYTAGCCAWADGDGERKLEELVDEAFDALAGAR